MYHWKMVYRIAPFMYGVRQVKGLTDARNIIWEKVQLPLVITLQPLDHFN